jgi:hypothetical protein
VDPLFHRVWTDISAGLHGPLKFRLILQPTVAAILAIRAGLRDAREGRTPFTRALLLDKGHRPEHLRRGWRDVWKVFAAATIVDVIYQLIVSRTAHPLQALVVAALLALLPYLVLTGPINRLARRSAHRRGHAPHEPTSAMR